MTERPGQWPVRRVDPDAVASTGDDAEQYLKRAAERGRHEIVLGSIRAHLEEQPTATAVYAALRHWISDLTSLGEDVARAKKRTA
ncbi:hypothetical protein [Streptomyces graminilatus]|uniref:hypothetical protein n=1 Tax=Streptomyces graminilatus TaxID=1464070 RepID=UPI0006E2C56E|nr:hypothetical protein [Streptomyces graminilatus]